MNRLADETSPYLRQHAENPVEWFPWGDEALRRAHEEDKPIFLSIGYASCHWCHVMAHESFEDAETAADLARSFISVKVDREERPDLDTVYMAATQALTGSGGWPMSVFCTPDGRPFYAGTYFPPVERHGMPSFRRVVQALGQAWVTERDEVLKQADALVAAVQRELNLAEVLGGADSGADSDGTAREGVGGGTLRGARGGADIDATSCIAAVVDGLRPGFDPEWGGFGPAPKFPRPTLVELCLRAARVAGPDKGAGEGGGGARHMAHRTLDAMAAGGIYDHIVGGFCRYSTDARWLVPHFEKMLTDQALLSRAYLHAWQDGGRSDYLAVATETLDWVLRDLSTPEGALYSSFDADAGGVEGAHATFSPQDLSAMLPPELIAPAADWYGITEAGNWEGRSIPVRPVGAPLERPPEIEKARALLADGRALRVQPARDEKVLTEWNAMAAATLAEVASAIGHDGYGRRAEEIGTFLWESMYVDGRLMRSWQGGRARHLAVAADHAWLAEACLRLSEWTGQRLWRERAVTAVRQLLELFWDEESGGFFTTGADAEALVVRPKEFLDGALPATNSIALTALLRTNALVEDPVLERAAERTIALARPLLDRHPGAVADLVSALPMWNGRYEIVVTGERPDLLAEVRRRWLPSAVTAWGQPDDGPLFAGRPSEPGRAYVCQARSCRMPAENAATLAAQLEALVA
ncbi:MAG TPA: thioredoxin domain-containing protein [Acidimicrobiales bacterium]|nr:thioredoxin domain-containing protein [Acidimicrobiales bacterium]